jgi:predicted amidohydrolase
MEKFKLALAQIESEPGNLDANLKKMLGYIDRAGDEGARMIIFPEMCLPGYMVMDGKDFHSFFALATDFKDSATEELLSSAKKNQLHIIYGASTRSKNVEGIYFNSAILLTADGRIELYHKSHLPTGNHGGCVFYEGLYAKHGSEFPVFLLPEVKLGMQVCFDAFFPEVSRILAIKGAELIVNISAAPVSSKMSFDKILQARALENVCYFAYVNVAGTQRGISFFGNSRLLNPLGMPVLELRAGEEDFGIAEFNPDLLSGLRRQLDMLRDRARRPEIYRELLEDFS